MKRQYMHGVKCNYFTPVGRVCNKCGVYVKEHKWWHIFWVVARNRLLSPLGFFNYRYCKKCDNFWEQGRSK